MMDSGVVYAAWLAGRWPLIAMVKPRRVARLSIGGRTVAARGGTHSTRVQWGGQTASRRKRWRCGVRHGRIPLDRMGQDGQQSAWVVVGGGGLCVLRWARTTAWVVACDKRTIGRTAQTSG